MGSVQLKVTLRGVKPPVWRRLVVPSTLTLAELSDAIQAAMGWTGLHLHLFDINGRQYGDLDAFDDEPIGDESRVKMSRIVKTAAKFRYDYDFGDGWEHDIGVEQALPATVTSPRCLAGRRACPPEDCGGPSGYADLLAALADPTHPDHAELAEWLGRPFDADEFNLDETNEQLADLFSDAR